MMPDDFLLNLIFCELVKMIEFWLFGSLLIECLCVLLVCFLVLILDQLFPLGIEGPVAGDFYCILIKSSLSSRGALS